MSKGILIADDSASSREIVRKGIEQAGFAICGEAVDGVDVVDKASELKPDLIILDLSLPRLNGIEAAYILRGRLPKTPIVLFTMYDTNPRHTLAAGITSVLRKEDGLLKLAECVQRLLGPQTGAASALSPKPLSARQAP